MEPPLNDPPITTLGKLGDYWEVPFLDVGGLNEQLQQLEKLLSPRPADGQHVGLQRQRIKGSAVWKFELRVRGDRICRAVGPEGITSIGLRSF